MRRKNNNNNNRNNKMSKSLPDPIESVILTKVKVYEAALVREVIAAYQRTENELKTEVKRLVVKIDRLTKENSDKEKEVRVAKAKLIASECKSRFLEARLQDSLGFWGLLLPQISHTANDPTLAVKVVKEFKQNEEDKTIVDIHTLYVKTIERMSSLVGEEQVNVQACAILRMMGYESDGVVYNRHLFGKEMARIIYAHTLSEYESDVDDGDDGDDRESDDGQSDDGAGGANGAEDAEDVEDAGVGGNAEGNSSDEVVDRDLSGGDDENDDGEEENEDDVPTRIFRCRKKKKTN